MSRLIDKKWLPLEDIEPEILHGILSYPLPFYCTKREAQSENFLKNLLLIHIGHIKEVLQLELVVGQLLHKARLNGLPAIGNSHGRSHGLTLALRDSSGL